MIKARGFGLLESIISVAIFGTVVTIGAMYAKTKYQNYQAQTLAQQVDSLTQFYSGFVNDPSVLSDIMFAEQSRCSMSLLSGQYKTYSYTDVKNALNNNLSGCLDSYKSVSYNVPSSVQGTNLYGEAACLGVFRNPLDNQLEAYLYFTGKPNRTENLKVLTKAVQILGGKASIYSANKAAVYSSGGWSIGSNSQVLSGCNGAAISPNSLVVNLNSDPVFNQQNSQTSLYKYENGDTAKIGSINSFKTLNSDTILGANNGTQSKIILAGMNSSLTFEPIASNSIADSSNGDKTIGLTLNKSMINNVVLQADGIQPTKLATEYDVCSPSEYGKIKLSSNKNVLSRCAMNTVRCTGSSYCYLADNIGNGPGTYLNVTGGSENRVQ